MAASSSSSLSSPISNEVIPADPILSLTTKEEKSEEKPDQILSLETKEGKPEEKETKRTEKSRPTKPFAGSLSFLATKVFDSLVTSHYEKEIEVTELKKILAVFQDTTLVASGSNKEESSLVVDTAFVSGLLPKPPSYPQTLLMYAIQYGCFPLAKACLEAGASTEIEFKIDREGKQTTTTALIEACHHTNIPLVKLLLEAGASIEAEFKIERDGKQTITTPLLEACYRGSDPLARLLIEKGASLKYVNELLPIVARQDMPLLLRRVFDDRRLDRTLIVNLVLELLFKNNTGNILFILNNMFTNKENIDFSVTPFNKRPCSFLHYILEYSPKHDSADKQRIKFFIIHFLLKNQAKIEQVSTYTALRQYLFTCDPTKDSQQLAECFNIMHAQVRVLRRAFVDYKMGSFLRDVDYAAELTHLCESHDKRAEEEVTLAIQTALSDGERKTAGEGGVPSAVVKLVGEYHASLGFFAVPAIGTPMHKPNGESLGNKGDYNIEDLRTCVPYPKS